MQAGSFFGAKCIAKIIYCNIVFTISTSAKLNLMHKTVKTVICLLLLIKNMLYNCYVYHQQLTCFVEFRCNFHFMPV